MRMALVGFTDSYNDRQWLAMAGAWLGENSPALPLSSAERFVFDLRGQCGVNFLDNDREFEVVVLFAIFNPPSESAEFRKALGRKSGQTSLAVNHSRKNWVARLKATAAEYIFVFRRDDSIDGEWLGEIEGYRRLPERSGVFGVSIYCR